VSRFVRMSQGVEWAVHVLLSLAWVNDDVPVSTAQFARGYDLPPAYLSKQLQALVRAGLLESVPGAKGGFRLVRPAGEISLMDVVTAIEGPEPAFVCTEIRQRGMGENSAATNPKTLCAVNAAMRRAEFAWRRSLAGQTITDVRMEAEDHAPGIADVVRGAYGRV
jgi:Rrf2 family protein